MKDSLSFLGKEVNDQVTQNSGIVVSVSVDISGLIQAAVLAPGKHPDTNQPFPAQWYDLPHLYVTNDKPVMTPPIFSSRQVCDALNMLGMEAVDQVTQNAGVVVSVSFDLYGCIQAALKPKGHNKDMMAFNGAWLDAHRLKMTSDTPITTIPTLKMMPEQDQDNQGTQKGPAELPPK